MRLTLCALALAGFALADDTDPVDPKVKPREVAFDARPDEFKAAAPAKITSTDEAAKRYGKGFADGLAKHVNFKAEYVIVFAWQGSGGDRVTMDVDGKTAKFTMKRGRTRDLAQHYKVFALPKGFKYEEPK